MIILSPLHGIYSAMQMITKVTWLFWTNQDITKSKKSAVLIIVVGQWYQLVPVALCHWCLTIAFSAVCDLLIKALKMGHVQVGMTYVKTCLQIFVREIETRWKEFFPPMMFAFRIQFGSSLLKEFIIRDERERENERERWSSKALRFDQTLRQKFLAGNKIIEFCRIWQSMLGIYFATPRRRRRSRRRRRTSLSWLWRGVNVSCRGSSGEEQPVSWWSKLERDFLS